MCCGRHSVTIYFGKYLVKPRHKFLSKLHQEHFARTPEAWKQRFAHVPDTLGHISVLDGVTGSADETPIRSGVGSIIAEYNPLVCYSLTKSEATHSSVSLLLTGVTRCHTSFQTLFSDFQSARKVFLLHFCQEFVPRYDQIFSKIDSDTMSPTAQISLLFG